VEPGTLSMLIAGGDEAGVSSSAMVSIFARRAVLLSSADWFHSAVYQLTSSLAFSLMSPLSGNVVLSARCSQTAFMAGF
jgi:hypothetical protein